MGLWESELAEPPATQKWTCGDKPAGATITFNIKPTRTESMLTAADQFGCEWPMFINATTATVMPGTRCPQLG